MSTDPDYPYRERHQGTHRFEKIDVGNLQVREDQTVLGSFTFGSVATDSLILKGRVSTMSAAGSAIDIGATYTYGEGQEIRYQVTDWTGKTTFNGLYLRSEAITGSAAGKSVRGTEIYGVCNDVTMTTGSLWGTLTYAYVKGKTAVTVNNMYAGQFELTWDAGRTADCTISTEAAVILAKVTGGRTADYTKIHGMIIRFGEMDGDSQKFGYGIHIEDDAAMAGTSTFTTGLYLEAGCDTGIEIAGACATSGLNITGTFASGGALNVGTFAAPITMYNTTDIPTVMISGDILADQISGVVKGLWVRSKISKEQPATSVIGVEAQCRVNGAVSAAATLGAGQFTGMWAYWEQSGTTALNTGALASAASCTVESATTLTIDSGAILAGLVVDSSVNAGTTNNGTFDGIYIKKASGALDFVSGIEMTDCISGEVFKFADDDTICNDDHSQAISNLTTAGYLTVKVGSSTRYIWLGSNAPTA